MPAVDESDPHAVTRLLEAVGRGDKPALDRLFQLIYAELRQVAARAMRREHGARTIQTTALVHEAYVRLLGSDGVPAGSRAQFLGIAARSMREILVDRARARAAAKRGDGDRPVTLDDGHGTVDPPSVDVLALTDALDRLASLDERQARIVELRYFAGMTVEETAALLELAPATIKREWAVARAWLYRELAGPR